MLDISLEAAVRWYAFWLVSEHDEDAFEGPRWWAVQPLKVEDSVFHEPGANGPTNSGSASRAEVKAESRSSVVAAASKVGFADPQPQPSIFPCPSASSSIGYAFGRAASAASSVAGVKPAGGAFAQYRGSSVLRTGSGCGLKTPAASSPAGV